MKVINTDRVSSVDSPHADHGVQVLSYAFRVRGVESRFRRRKARFGHHRFHRHVDLFEFIELIDVRHVAAIQDIVQIFQKGLALDLSKRTRVVLREPSCKHYLSIREEKDRRRVT